MPQQEQVILIGPDGSIKFVWDDALAGLVDEGRANVTRAGAVEPTPDGRWTADLRMIGGGVYGPYPLRQAALDHERAVVTGRMCAGLL